MLRKRTAIVGAVAVGAVVVGGVAYTNAVSLPAATHVGYGNVQASGATVSAMTYTINANPALLTATVLTIDGDVRTDTIKAQFSSAAGTPVPADDTGVFPEGGSGAWFGCTPSQTLSSGNTVVTCTPTSAVNLKNVAVVEVSVVKAPTA